MAKLKIELTPDDVSEIVAEHMASKWNRAASKVQIEWLIDAPYHSADQREDRPTAQLRAVIVMLL